MQIKLLGRQVIQRHKQAKEKHRQQQKALGRATDNAVIPREYGQFVQPGDQVPPRGDVARYEDAEGEDGKGWFRVSAFEVLRFQDERIAWIGVGYTSISDEIIIES
ncbi:uncharacterized protein TRUGW13939_03276 [Talaromyces rugulosus]|uniref:Uncharacterized protein n=1 Tax=Talaromyces rugulosus TaxID=121627 RepID=A0A7H8QQQ8_TALRU|nr:uncharacterized protein TRUGW13939_03276 [Talaromyces rugulosus]QKX56176.1 hypothetical protein TRUGW13939_03276 [Talaromyces rugulosus]